MIPYYKNGNRKKDTGLLETSETGENRLLQ
jgi:hypothetical protein